MGGLKMKQKLEQALQDLRECRNNMAKEEFLHAVNDITEDANIAVPLMQAASVCSMHRLRKNAERNE